MKADKKEEAETEIKSETILEINTMIIEIFQKTSIIMTKDTLIESLTNITTIEGKKEEGRVTEMIDISVETDIKETDNNVTLGKRIKNTLKKAGREKWEKNSKSKNNRNTDLYLY